MSNRAQSRHSDRNWRRSDLRYGYTTSACAAACAAAGLRTLIENKELKSITIDLPGESGVIFSLNTCKINPDGVLYGTIKDSGDDPDVTDGAEIQAFTSWQTGRGITIAGGVGVGLVTKPGLPVEVGDHAVNPGARRLIKRVVRDAGGAVLVEKGLRIEIRVPEGEALAKETMNPRLGIIGGISILGTTGILKPYSNSAYRASIYTELKFAGINGAEQVVLTTGSRSEEYARKMFDDRDKVAFVQVGDHMDYALKQCRRLDLKSVVISGMIGKLSKLAQGRMQTHVSQGGVDFQFLARTAEQLGAGTLLREEIEQARTAHHVQKMMLKANLPGLEDYLAQTAAEQCFNYAKDLDQVDVLLYSIQGELLAHGKERRQG
jgi:cobalt-precorrin-5B (C1)-methyltransferase